MPARSSSFAVFTWLARRTRCKSVPHGPPGERSRRQAAAPARGHPCSTSAAGHVPPAGTNLRPTGPIRFTDFNARADTADTQLKEVICGVWRRIGNCLPCAEFLEKSCVCWRAICWRAMCVCWRAIGLSQVKPDQGGHRAERRQPRPGRPQVTRCVCVRRFASDRNSANHGADLPPARPRSPSSTHQPSRF